MKRRRVDDHFQESIIVSHEPAAQFLARHVNRARTEDANSKRPGRWVVTWDPEMAATVAKLLAKLRKPVVIH